MARPLRFTSGVQQVMIRIPKEQYEQLLAKTDRDGIPMAEQIRRALTKYLKHEPIPKRRTVSLSPKHAINE